MNFRLRLSAFAIASTLALTGARPASAELILTMNNDAKGGVDHLVTVTWTFNGVTETGLAGTVATSQVSGGQPLDTYCIDLYHDFYVGNGGTSWQVGLGPISSFSGDAGVSAPDNAGGHAGAIGYLYEKYASVASTDIEGAALQVAIWKVDYDGNNLFSTGSFRFAATPGDSTTVQSRVFAQATAYLAGFDGTQSSDNATYFRATSHPNGLYQDLVGPGNAPATAVPEPSLITMVGLGLAAVVARARWLRRSTPMG
jgi:hypothetical protein